MAQALYKYWFVDFGPFRDGEFVDSELGPIPKGWEVVKLGDVVSIGSRTINLQNYPDEGFLHFSIPAFDAGRMPAIERGKQILSGKTLVDSNRVLVSKLNPRIYRVWTVFALKDQRAISSTEYINYIPKRSETWAFVNCYVRHERFINEFCSHATGTTGSR
jgi:type I restriction enzyme S subunit